MFDLFDKFFNLGGLLEKINGDKTIAGLALAPLGELLISSGNAYFAALGAALVAASPYVATWGVSHKVNKWILDLLGKKN